MPESNKINGQKGKRSLQTVKSTKQEPKASLAAGYGQNINPVRYFLFTFFVFLMGCMPYREVMKTTSTNCNTLPDGRFIYENDTLKITYSFWSENGKMDMRIYNKRSVPIFIDWKVSNYINNNNSLQYWYNVQNATSTTNGINYYGLQTPTGIPVSLKHGVTNTTTEQPDRIVSIPPGSSIKNTIFYNLTSKDLVINTGDFTFDNSPLKFRNYLVFSLDENFTNKFYVDNQFYVSNAKTISEDKFWNESHTGSPYSDPKCFFSGKIYK
jgi:hypothetical protein